MKIKPKKRLFWFIRDDILLDLDNEQVLNMYIQQVLTRGRYEDIKELLEVVSPYRFRTAFEKIKIFIPKNIRDFWEDYFGSFNQTAKKSS